MVSEACLACIASKTFCYEDLTHVHGRAEGRASLSPDVSSSQGRKPSQRLSLSINDVPLLLVVLGIAPFGVVGLVPDIRAQGRNLDVLNRSSCKYQTRRLQRTHTEKHPMLAPIVCAKKLSLP